MEEEIAIHDIDRTHRVGKRKLNNNVTRPIIIKFARYNAHNSILGMCGHMTVKILFLDVNDRNKVKVFYV